MRAKTGIGKFDLEKVYKNNNHYKVIYSQVAPQILRTVRESFKSDDGKVTAYKIDIPKIPNYRNKGVMTTLNDPKLALNLKGNKILDPLGNICKP